MQGLPSPRVESVSAGQPSYASHERVFDAMLDGWRAQILARGLTGIENRSRLVRRFQEFSGEFPWQLAPDEIDDFLAERRSGEKPISLTTLRSDSNAVGDVLRLPHPPSLRLDRLCERTFGDMPAQIPRRFGGVRQPISFPIHLRHCRRRSLPRLHSALTWGRLRPSDQALLPPLQLPPPASCR